DIPLQRPHTHLENCRHLRTIRILPVLDHPMNPHHPLQRRPSITMRPQIRFTILLCFSTTPNAPLRPDTFLHAAIISAVPSPVTAENTSKDSFSISPRPQMRALNFAPAISPASHQRSHISATSLDHSTHRMLLKPDRLKVHKNVK